MTDEKIDLVDLYETAVNKVLREQTGGVRIMEELKKVDQK